MNTDKNCNRQPSQRRTNEIVSTGQTYDQDAANIQAQGKTAILIISNGSRFQSEPYGQLAELLSTLAAEPLRADWSANPKAYCAGFVDKNPRSCQNNKPLLPPGWIWFHGNFENISHVFHVVTNDPQAIVDLTTAIRDNLQSAAYKAARKQFAAGRGLLVV